MFQGSLDNISINIVCFNGAPKVTPEALQREAEVEQIIDQKVEGKLKLTDLLFNINTVKKTSEIIVCDGARSNHWVI